MFSVVIDGMVFADGKKPRGDAVGVESGQGRSELDEGVLHDVTSVFEAGREGEGVADERALVAVQERFKGRKAVAHAGQVHGATRGSEIFLGAPHHFFSYSETLCVRKGVVSAIDASWWRR